MKHRKKGAKKRRNGEREKKRKIGAKKRKKGYRIENRIGREA